MPSDPSREKFPRHFASEARFYRGKSAVPALENRTDIYLSWQTLMNKGLRGVYPPVFETEGKTPSGPLEQKDLPQNRIVRFSEAFRSVRERGRTGANRGASAPRESYGKRGKTRASPKGANCPRSRGFPGSSPPPKTMNLLRRSRGTRRRRRRPVVSFCSPAFADDDGNVKTEQGFRGF